MQAYADSKSVFYCRGVSYSILELKRLAAFLFTKITPSKGVDFALVVTDDSYMLLASLLALWARGYSPVMPNGFQADALKALAYCTYAISDDSKLSEELSKISEVLIIEDPKAEVNGIALEAFEQALKDMPLSLTISQMTSGSTGNPKTITRTLQALFQEAQILQLAMASKLELDSNCISAATVPLYHAYGLEFRFIFPLLAKMSIFSSLFEYEEQLRLLNSYNKNIYLVSSSGFLKRLSSEKLLSSVTVVLTAGGAISPEVITKVNNSFGSALFEILGSTESGVMACRFVDSLSTSWQAPLGNKFYVLKNKESNSILQSSGSGILAVSSSYIDKSLQQLFKDEQGIKRSVFVSDDIVDLNSQGELGLLGRTSRVVKFEDNRVSLDDLERKLSTHEWIEAAVVIATNSGHRDCILAMFKLSKLGQMHYEKVGLSKFILSLRATLKNYILPICIPRKIKIVPAFPLTATGKIAYKEVKRILCNEIS